MATASSTPRTVLVSFTVQGEAKVTFNGVWTRRDIERAGVAMLKNLPIHIKQMKEKVAKDGRTS